MKKAINLTNLSDSELVNWINQSENKLCDEYYEMLITEFTSRDWNYTNLVLKTSDDLELSCPIYLSQRTLFEVNIPYPSMVNNFFKTVLQPILNFLDELDELKGKELVTLPFVADQLFLGSRVKSIELQELASLNENQIFVFIRQFGKTFPEMEKVYPNLKNKTILTFDKGERYRGLVSVQLETEADTVVFELY